jgi:hypothetical protein
MQETLSAYILLVTLTIEKMHTFEISWKIPNSDSLLQSKFNCYIPIKGLIGNAAAAAFLKNLKKNFKKKKLI